VTHALRGAALALVLALSASAHAAPQEDAGWLPIVVKSAPAPISDKAGNGARYGALIFRGGVALTSPNAMFGGWSGIEVDGEGRFIAVSDAGSFLKGRLTLDEKGELTGVAETQIAVVRDKAGQPIDGKFAKDAEDITRLPDGRYAVAFEGNHRIELYDLDGKGPAAGAVAGPPVPQTMGSNEGIEALTVTADGDLLAGREFSANAKPPTEFFKLSLTGAHDTVIGAAQVDANYGLVAMRRLSSGDVLALERFYFPIIGNRSTLRRYRGAGLTAETPHLAGPVLAKLEKPLALDNFEGLAVIEKSGAPTRLYLLSDDNFAPGKQTLLYAFDLAR
jgi:hypothetical protein